jgi:hypothetical protein
MDSEGWEPESAQRWLQDLVPERAQDLAREHSLRRDAAQMRWMKTAQLLQPKGWRAA